MSAVLRRVPHLVRLVVLGVAAVALCVGIVLLTDGGAVARFWAGVLAVLGPVAVLLIWAWAAGTFDRGSRR